MPHDAEYEMLRELAISLAHAGHGAKHALVEAAAARLGVTKQTVYARLKRLSLTMTGRKRRADAGRLSVDEATARAAAGLVMLATRANDKRTTSVRLANSLISANGRGAVDAETGEVRPVAPATLARAMRAYHCHPEQIAAGHPAVMQRSLHPNHVWQVDSSVCTLFYAPGGGTEIRAIDEREVYKNKPDAVAKVARDLCQRWIITDHASGAMRVRYVAGAETAASFIDVFIEAIQTRESPMYGVPKILVMDPGSAARAATARNLLERLGVRVIVHRTKNPRAKGQVEGAHNIWETWFEGRLAIKGPRDMGELNAWADRAADAYNAGERHSRHGMPRYAAWMRIRAEQLTLAPDVESCRELAVTKPETRVVSNQLTISYATRQHGAQEYDVRHVSGAAPRERLTVVVNAYRAPAVDVLVENEDGTVTPHTVEPITRDDWGFATHANTIGEAIRGLPKTVAERQGDAIRTAAYGVPTQAEAEAARKARETAFDGVINPFADIEQTSVPTYLPRRGTQHALANARAERGRPPVPLVDAARRLIAAGWSAEGLYTGLQTEFPAGEMPADELDRRLAGDAATSAAREAGAA